MPDYGYQDQFNMSIGQLDRCLSELIHYAKSPITDNANKQTLKHHAEDMIAAGEKILKLLGNEIEGTPQPS